MASPESSYRKHLNRLNELVSNGESLSGHERNCAFLNIQGGRFATVSSVSGLDFDDDARSPVSIDWDRDGDLDLWVANRTAPQLRFLRNNTPKKNDFVSLRLRGTKSNIDGIGARVEISLKKNQAGPPLIKTLKAGEGFLGQSSKWLHFGLGHESTLDQVIVKWPGGASEKFSSISPNGHFLLEEGTGSAQTIKRQVISLPHTSKPAPVSLNSNSSRILTPTRTALPPLRYTDLQGKSKKINLSQGHPILINLWASWCPACLEELSDWKVYQNDLSSAGIEVITISTDLIDGREDTSADTTRSALDKLSLPFAAGIADEELYTRLRQAHNWPFLRRIPMPVPTSFLVDGQGRLTVIYRGTISANQIIADTKLFPLNHNDLLAASLPFPGRWMFPPNPPAPMLHGIELMEKGDVVDAAEFTIGNLELLKPHREFPLLAIWISEKLMAAGDTDRGLLFLRWAAESDSSNIAVVNNLAWQLATNPSERVRNPQLALQWAEKANTMTGGKHPAVLDTVATANAAAGNFNKSIQLIELGIRIATTQGDEATSAPMRKRLELFKAGKPFLETPPSK